MVVLHQPASKQAGLLYKLADFTAAITAGHTHDCKLCLKHDGMSWDYSRPSFMNASCVWSQMA